MHTRTTTALAALLLATLTACGTEPTPVKPATKPSTASSPTLNQAEQAKACTDAIVALKPDADGEVPSDPRPAACASLDTDTYLNAYMDGLEQRNQAARDELQRQIEEAEQQDQ